MPKPRHIEKHHKASKEDNPRDSRPTPKKIAPEATHSPRFILRKSTGRMMVARKGKDSIMEKKSNFFGSLIKSSFVLKLLNSRASQFISAGAGFVVGHILASGFLEKIQGNELLTTFLSDIGISPTEAGITSLVTTLFWAFYNLGMTLAYGAKFKEIQEAHGLVADRWAGPKTMEAATKVIS